MQKFDEIGRKMDALGIWDVLLPYNWAVKPLGTAFPYFCTLCKGDGKLVKMRLLMLEGWQTMHDYVRLRCDSGYGFRTSPDDFEHYDLIILASGEIRLLRSDPGFVPADADERQQQLVARILWEFYGLMLRIEADPKLPVKFASEKAVFARIEKSPGVWEDAPLEIPDVRPLVENPVIQSPLLKDAKDLPFSRDAVFDVSLRMLPNVVTKEKRPRRVFQFVIYDGKSSRLLFESRMSFVPEFGLRGLWESAPQHLLNGFVHLKSIPGEVRLNSQRLFRFLRPLCVEIPMKLSLHDDLKTLSS